MDRQRGILGGVVVVILIATLSIWNPAAGDIAVTALPFAGVQVPPSAKFFPDFAELFYGLSPASALRDLVSGAFIGVVIVAIYEAVQGRLPEA